jgi:hypothetical protein
MTYSVDYCCLSQFASRWTPFFKSGAQPPTPLPDAMLLLNLTKTPTLVDFTTETANGLTYFRPTYSSGVETDVTISEESDIKTHSWTVETPPRTIPVGYYMTPPFSVNSSPDFYQTGEKTISGTSRTFTQEYISVTQRATSKNANLPTVHGYILGIDTTVKQLVESVILTTGNVNYASKVRNTFSKTKNARGEFSYSVSSTGVM